MLKQSGTVVYLRTSVEQQVRRLSRDKSRPLLQSGDREEKLARLAEERNPLYEEIADVVFPRATAAWMPRHALSTARLCCT